MEKCSSLGWLRSAAPGGAIFEVLGLHTSSHSPHFASSKLRRQLPARPSSRGCYLDSRHHHPRFAVTGGPHGSSRVDQKLGSPRILSPTFPRFSSSPYYLPQIYIVTPDVLVPPQPRPLSRQSLESLALKIFDFLPKRVFPFFLLCY